jgi:hypothetical protein
MPRSPWQNELPRMTAAIPQRQPATEQISGVIERVTFHNEDSGFCVLPRLRRRDLESLHETNLCFLRVESGESY